MSSKTEMYVDYYKWLVEHDHIKKYYKEYLEHVIEHKRNVYIAWLYVCDPLCELGFIDRNDIDSISKSIINHDESKLYLEEFIPYARRFNGPRQKESRVKINFKEAVKLHKERNLHHYEALKLYKGDNWKQYAVELICDYIAMGWEFDNYICEYFEKVKDELKKSLPNNYYNYIESIIRIIPEKLPYAEAPLTEETIEIIYYLFNEYNDPFEDTYVNDNDKTLNYIF